MKGSNFPDIDFSRLTVPPAELKIVRRNGVFKVYDRLRKNYFNLTPEEFVRQIFVAWLIDRLGFPASLMANEIGIRLNETSRRCDTVVFTPEGHPFVIIEYKSPSMKIDQDVFNQIVRYNMALKADYLMVSNGYTNFCCHVDYTTHTVKFLEEIPSYSSIKQI